MRARVCVRVCACILCTVGSPQRQAKTNNNLKVEEAAHSVAAAAAATAIVDCALMRACSSDSHFLYKFIIYCLIYFIAKCQTVGHGTRAHTHAHKYIHMYGCVCKATHVAPAAAIMMYY